jgi:hypothetical protein
VKFRLQLATDELLTDGSIRGRDLGHLVDRDLTGVSDSWLDSSTHASFDSGLGGGGGKGAGNWDQFAANSKLSGYKGTKFDENLYTKKLDKGSISKAKQEAAERMAHAIESQTSDNVHLQQERGHAMEEGDGDGDEEALWSGVMGSGRFAKGSAVTKTNTTADTGVWKRGGGAATNGKSVTQKLASPKAVTTKTTSSEKPTASTGTWASRAAGVDTAVATTATPAVTTKVAEKPVQPQPSPKSKTEALLAVTSASPQTKVAATEGKVEADTESKDKKDEATGSEEKKPALKASAKEFVFVPKITAKEYTPSVTAVTKAITGNIATPAPAPVLAPSPQMPPGFPQAHLPPGVFDPNMQMPPGMMSPSMMQPTFVDEHGNVIMMNNMMAQQPGPGMMHPSPYYGNMDQGGYNNYQQGGGYPYQQHGYQGQGYDNRGRGGGGGRGRGGGGGRGGYERREYQDRYAYAASSGVSGAPAPVAAAPAAASANPDSDTSAK